MSSLAEEDEAGIALVVRAHRALQKLNPNHELLGLIQVNHEHSFSATEEFNKKYREAPKSNGYPRADSYGRIVFAPPNATGRYEQDLTDAIRKELNTRLKKEGLLDITKAYFR
jgi:hypothetical protein